MTQYYFASSCSSRYACWWNMSVEGCGRLHEKKTGHHVQMSSLGRGETGGDGRCFTCSRSSTPSIVSLPKMRMRCAGKSRPEAPGETLQFNSQSNLFEQDKSERTGVDKRVNKAASLKNEIAVRWTKASCFGLISTHHRVLQISVEVP